MKPIWIRWLINSTIGQFFAIVLSVLMARGYFLKVGEPLTTTDKFLFIAVMLISGLVHGTIISVFQWPVLKSKFPKLLLHKWWRATVSVTLLIWFIGMLPALYLPLDPGINKPELLPGTATVIVVSSIFGLAFGLLFGWIQWLPLKRHASNAGKWIWINAIAWTIGNLWVGLAYIYWYKRETIAETIGYSLFCALMLSIMVSLISSQGIKLLLPRKGS